MTDPKDVRELPVLPLKNAILFPHFLMPLSVGRANSLAAVQAALASEEKEIVLVAQDSTRYGLDHGLRDGLAYLLRRLGRVEGIRWIRVMYAYPATLTDAILDAMASEEKVVKYSRR